MLPVFNKLTLLVEIITSVSSVILYFFVFLLSRKHASGLRRNHQTNQSSLQAFNNQQRQLTATMGISCAFTLILYVLPLCLKYAVVNNLNSGSQQICLAFIAISCNLTPLTNFAIVFLRHREIRCRLIDPTAPCFCAKFLPKAQVSSINATKLVNVASKIVNRASLAAQS
ncbi:unnamed protein product [Anisakis simplex]|uniref:G_PROTEIN_RECEP_F1_2 domain-containing protein n=1 Tax=Anisakis simplex TaxID=6269 RepID=A0A0M3J125_ANISI|nr:unnamed protein product [Anisakis simplex]